MGKVVWHVCLSKCRPVSSEDGHTKTGMPSTILCQISVKCYGWPTIAGRCKTVKLLGAVAAPIKTRARRTDTGYAHLSGKSSNALSQLCPLISDYSQTLMVLTNNTARKKKRETATQEITPTVNSAVNRGKRGDWKIKSRKQKR